MARQIASTFLLLGYFTVVTLPVLWLGATAVKDRTAITAAPPELLFTPTMENFTKLFLGHDVVGLVVNSLVVALGTVSLTIILGAPSAYWLSQQPGVTSRRFLVFLLSTKMVPLVAVSLPAFIVFKLSGLQGSRVGLVLAESVAALPFAIWLLTGFFADVPVALRWAAQLDGLSHAGALWRVVVRAAAPGVAAVCILTFLYSWNDYMLATLLTTQRSRTLTAELPVLVSQSITQWGQLAAGGFISLLPAVFVALSFRGQLVAGVTGGILRKT